MHINIFDRTLKRIGYEYSETFLKLAFPGISYEILNKERNVELIVPERRTDFVQEALLYDQRYIFHMEFQLKGDKDFARRMFTYSALLTEKYNLPVVSIVLYIEKSEDVIDEYRVLFGNNMTNRFWFRALRLWDYRDEIRSGKFKELAPLLVLVTDEKDEGVLRDEKRLILMEKNDELRNELLSYAIIIASRYFDKGFLLEFFREEVEKMRGSTIVEEWIEEAERKASERGFQEGIQQGMQQGIQQGKREGLYDAISLGLELKFGTDGLALVENMLKIESVEKLEVIKEAIKIANRLEDIIKLIGK